MKRGWNKGREKQRLRGSFREFKRWWQIKRVRELIWKGDLTSGYSKWISFSLSRDLYRHLKITGIKLR